jgi:predicted naringenin-chalcone synthase
MTNIFSGELIEAMNIRNLLENVNIEVFTVNEYMSSIEPWVVSPGGFKPVLLKVNDEDFEKAKKVVEEYGSGKLEIEK